MTKEWSEVMTGSSPGSPNEESQQGKPLNEVARRRILQVDPRSISDDVTRTPIQVERATNSEESTPARGNVVAPSFLDPRSPSHDLPRTPIAPNPPVKGPLNLDDSLEASADDNKPPAPTRGAIVADLKELEKKMEQVRVLDDYEKEEGEITHDDDDEDFEHAEKKELMPEVKPKPLILHKNLSLEQLSKIAEHVTDEKEEGEITHDSDDEENVENSCQKTPITIRSKVQMDCRSPLLIENDEPQVFEKVLTHELAAMAAKGTSPVHSNSTVARQRKPLGEVKTENHEDSLVI